MRTEINGRTFDTLKDGDTFTVYEVITEWDASAGDPTEAEVQAATAHLFPKPEPEPREVAVAGGQGLAVFLREDFHADTITLMVRQDVAGTLAYAKVTDTLRWDPTKTGRPRLALEQADRDGAGYDPDAELKMGLEVPEPMLAAIHKALENHYGTPGALRRAEDMLEERDAEVRELREELAKMTLARDLLERINTATGETLAAVRHHLEDNSMGLDKEAARADRLEAKLEAQTNPDGLVINPAKAYMGPEGMWIPAGGPPVGITGLDPADFSPDPWATCGHISPENVGGALQPPRRCIRPLGSDDHRTIVVGDQRQVLHTDGRFAWSEDGTAIGTGYTTTD